MALHSYKMFTVENFFWISKQLKWVAPKRGRSKSANCNRCVFSTNWLSSKQYSEMVEPQKQDQGIHNVLSSSGF